MATLAKIILVGNLGRNPETRYTPNGTMNLQFTMAVNRRWNDQSGQQQERTNWFRITAWGRLAETLDGLAQSGALTQGKQVFVEGRFEAREYQDQTGQTRTSLDVNADTVMLLGSRTDAEAGGAGFAPSAPAPARPARGPQRGGNQPDQFDEGTDLEDVPF